MKLSPEARFTENIRCWFKEMGRDFAPILETPEALAPKPDRCYLAWSLESQQMFSERMDRWCFSIGAHRPLGRETAVQGWRERRALYSVQIVEHLDLEVGRFFEMDVDDSNPNWGLGPLIGHGVQWFRWKISGYKLSPWKVAKARGWEAAQA